MFIDFWKGGKPIEYYKTLKIPVKCNKTDYKYLLECGRYSAEVWNKCLEIDKEYQKNNPGKWIDMLTLQKVTKSCVPLHSKNINHVVHKYLYSRDAVRKAKKQGRIDEKYPYKQKNHFVTGWDYQAIKVDYQKNILYLGRQQLMIDGKIVRQKHVKCYTKYLPQNIVEVELIWSGKLYLVVKYKEDGKYLKIKSSNETAIDYGEIHSITAIDKKGNAIIITGRLLRSIKRLRNKELSKIYKRMSKCKQGSRQYRKYMNALEKLRTKSRRQLDDCIHKITRYFRDYCIINKINKVYYGDLDSCTRGTRDKCRGNTTTRQKLGQWEYGSITQLLENKLNKFGIEMVKVKEYYTSSTCPHCGEKYHPKNREWLCPSCGYKQHRDLVGAINILKNNSNKYKEKYKTFKYLQIV